MSYIKESNILSMTLTMCVCKIEAVILKRLSLNYKETERNKFRNEVMCNNVK